MDSKMERFLTSIKIEDISIFDMSFDFCARNIFNHNQIDMAILKESPWEYPLLRLFLDHLTNISYPYKISFSYKIRPLKKDCIALFKSWFLDLYRIELPFEISSDSSLISIVYFSQEDKDKYNSVFQDFIDMLDLINYDFSFEHIVKEVVIKDSEDDNNFENIVDIIKQEQTDIQNQFEDALLSTMQENARLAALDRERIRRNKKGNYSVIDKIDDITKDSGNVDFDATIFSIDSSTFRGKTRLLLGVNDLFNGAIYVNSSFDSKNVDKINQFKKGVKLRIRGCSYIDEYTHNLTIKGHNLDLLPPEEAKKDEVELQRVELHLHSKMSAMDSVSSMMDYCTLAKQLGMKALALTDHGVVQAFPEAQKAGKKTGIKILYGNEFYMVNDAPEFIKNPSNDILNRANYVVLDLETTGLACRYDKIIEFGAVRVENGNKVASLDILIDPEIPIPSKIVEITNITDEMVKGKPKIEEAIDKIVDFVKDSIIVTHNADFDFPFLNEVLTRLNRPILTNPVVDTLWLSRYVYPLNKKHKLGALCKQMGVDYDDDDAHRADYDADVTCDVWLLMLALLTKNNPNMRHFELSQLKVDEEMLKHLRPFHVVVLAKNYKGLKDLYRLISLSHTTFLAEIPKLPRKELSKVRENLLIGSGCFNGEVFDYARTKNEKTLEETISFYDYIEIQPISNYSFLWNMKDVEEDFVKVVIKDIVKAAEKKGKKIVATGDVHYARKSDKIFRDIYIETKGLGGVPHPLNPYNRHKYPPFENPDQHLRSTSEMLQEFEWLGKEKAFEYVVTNSIFFADQIEAMLPAPNDVLYKPFIPNVENMLRDLCYKNAYELYGNPLPEFINARLEAELNGIINNGFSVIYYIAHKIVKKSNDDGFVVGSRGSVGSSFVATMANITEVNPLPPHYRCPKCKKVIWGKSLYPSIKSGYDLPEMECSECHTKMVKDGQDIPFETFLGFAAEKVPDIDLNFPRDYQSRAHDYTKVLLGEDNVFRAGTIETVADKTAFGYARGYFERKGVDPNTVPKAKIAYLASGCVDVKRTTGQHPGGIIVIPSDHVVYDFTPIQFPADEKNSTWKTTHFDFHSIHDTVLKLDLLGHLDPMALKMMADMTGVNIEDIPMNDPKVLSLFYTSENLRLSTNYLKEKTGALAIPEFGTEFVRGILESTKPHSFSDLVIISGLSHGTDVWLGNADKLISSGITDLRGVIGCRDDIMTYLIDKGLSSSLAFAIMERVRHGDGLTPEFEEEMFAHKVPQYYIDSCKKIKYLFPKGHATAYVMMAIRVGYFKIYYPLEFYATFFTVRSKQYDIKTMVEGQDAIIKKIEELNLKEKSKIEKLTPKDVEIRKTLLIAIEMVERGMSFSNIDINKSDATRFIVDKENNSLIPPFIVVDGLGESAAATVIEERAKGEFLSIEDLQRRTTLNGTNIKDLKNLGVLDCLSESDQMSLFDFGLD